MEKNLAEQAQWEEQNDVPNSHSELPMEPFNNRLALSFTKLRVGNFLNM